MQLTDTHCHIHEAPLANAEAHDATQKLWAKNGGHDPDAMIAAARQAGVTRLVCVGCTPADSERAIAFAAKRPDVWASIGIHPHEAGRYADNQTALQAFAALATRPKVVAVGECGLDYFYTHSSRADQEKLLHVQLALAQEYKLPVIFHVREAFGDFWPIFDQYPDLRGVVHSFTATKTELEQIVARGLYVGLNGITTFMKQPAQLEAVKAVPLDNLLLETDAPFLTPIPYRGTICEPKHVRVTAEFLAGLRDAPLAEIAERSTANARKLFGI